MVLASKPATPPILERHDATWQDYLTIGNHPTLDWQKISFYQGWLWVNMGKEGPEHASVSDFITIIFGFWAFLHPDVPLQSYGRCLIEYPETHACAPDLVLYKGENIPRYQAGEPRRIDLRFQRPPDLVGEIADTTLSLDLDEQKQLYASLGIPEYWVIDVKGRRVFAFGLAEDRRYRAIAQSEVLAGLPMALLEQALERLANETNTAAANWLLQQLQRQA
ncbi:Uma2 family endonuclease [Synechococcus sp. H55.11]|uniref:Uma2 family endonuclease n=1 Tax=unclassified Synechococcus TaxID=2626047 RepID=UPI0039C115DC